MGNNLPKPFCPQHGACAVCGVLEPAQRFCQCQQTLAGATDSEGPKPQVPSHSLAKGMLPVKFLRLDVLQNPMGKQLPVTAMEISSAPPRL